MIYINRFMKEAIEALEIYKSPNKYLNIELNNMIMEIWPNFLEINGCIINNWIKENIEIDINEIIKRFGSIEGYEDFENHTHIADIFNCSVKQSLKFGLIIKDMWKKRLEMLFPNYDFKIILWYDGKDKYNTILRFYRIRKNGIDLYNNSEIELYEKTGILFETFGKNIDNFEEIKVGDEVELVSFNSKNSAENYDELDRSENYFILIGSLGIVEKIEEKVLVRFKQKLDDLGLINHNEIRNALWISKKDIKKKRTIT